MFGFLKMFIGFLSTCKIGFFGESLAFNSKGHIKCVSLNNQSCQARPTLVETPLLLVLINVVENVTQLMIHMLKFVFQIK